MLTCISSHPEQSDLTLNERIKIALLKESLINYFTSLLSLGFEAWAQYPWLP